MKFLPPLLLAAVLTLPAAAQDAAVKLRIRAVLHNPLNPYAELYVPGAAGTLERLNLSMEGLTTPQVASTAKGKLNLFSSPTVDPENPLANLAASLPVPAGLKQAIILVLPADEGQKVPYRLMVIDDSRAKFAMGESRIVNMTRLPLGFKAGEHTVPVLPAKIATVPPVTKRNDLNQAPTAFYRRDGDTWILLSERPMQFTDELRNIFLIYPMPNVEEPRIRTLVDTSPLQAE